MTPETLSAVRESLPWWVIALPLAAPLLAAPVAYFLAWLGIRVAGRGLQSLDPAAHWTERARHVFVVRRTVLRVAALPVLATAPLVVGGPASVGRRVALALVVVVALVALVAAAFRAENRWVRRAPAPARARSLLGLVLVFYSGFLAPLVLLAFGFVSLQALGLAGWLLAMVVVSAAFTFGGGLLLARALGLVRPAPERVRAALARALPPDARPPRAVMLCALSANAFALPWLGLVGVMEGALEHLDDEALTAVLAHELEHLREPAAVRALRVLFALATALVIPVAIAILWAHSVSVPALLGAIAVLAAYLAAAVGFRRVSRWSERRSDAAAREASPAYALALEAIYRANLIPAVLPQRATHPDLVERMTAAGMPPSWPVPPPPPSSAPAVAAVAVPTLFLVVALVLAPMIISGNARDEGEYLAAVAVSGGAADLGNLGLARNTRGASAEAAPLFRAASELDTRNPVWPAWEAASLALAGRCQEASLAIANASARGQGNPAYILPAQAALSSCKPR
jgi:Zn-dependent protease with chaperone function